MGADGSTGGRGPVGLGPGLGWLGAGVRLARGWGSVGAGWGPGGAGERASMGAMRRRGQHEGGRKSPIGAHPDRNGRRGGWRRAWARRGRRNATRIRRRDERGRRRAQARWRGGACGKQARPAPQDAKPVRPCRVSHAAAAWRKARSAGPQAAAAERPRGAGNIFASCVISGSSTRKRVLGGKIRAPCIPNRPIAPGNGCIGRGCCHLDLEKHAFRAEVARKGSFFAHSTKKGCMRCDSCQPWPRGRRNARGGTRAAARGGRDGSDAGGTSRWQRPRRRFWICSMAT